MEIKGNKLTLEDQKYVLSAYVYRYTGDNKPAWANSIRYKPQFKTDQEWLENTVFYCKKNGRLDARYKHCTSGTKIG